ncbi:MAG TPA: 3-dehydroquinate synthase [Gemmatimonadales bacterium]|nr:3-dehydroquinate synthase [Gemmatimonadales bacterium]
MTLRVPVTEHRDASYDILIGRGLLAHVGALVGAACPAHRYAVISDAHVARLCGPTVLAGLAAAGLAGELFQFPPGEAHKTRETWALLADRLLAAHVGRDAAILALGGGVVGDVAGFVAATYLRGVPYVQLPTTLLAMIDSSIGGKTGVDAPAGKNLLGAFHQPRLVVVDLDVLGSLPAQELAAGMAEAVKHGVIADAEYFASLERDHQAVAAKDPAALERVVRRSIEIKAAIVAADEREAGRRAVLNFGHTVGHAIEATAQCALLHGEAVAIGMRYEAQLAEALGVAERGTAQRIQGVLERYGLPVSLPDGASVDQLVATMELDKKARAGTVRFALPQAVGQMREQAASWTVGAPAGLVRDVLRARAP